MLWRRRRATVDENANYANCASLAGGQSGSESAARWRSSSLMASKVRQSVFGSFFGSSLNLVILLFFMRLRSSGGYNTNDVAPHRVGDEEHPAVDQANSVETQLASGIAVIELRRRQSNHVRIRYLFKPARPSIALRHRRLREPPVRSRLFAQWPLCIGSLARPPSIQTVLAARFSGPC